MNLFALTRPLRDRPWLGFFVGLVAVLLGLAVRMALGDLALKFPFVIFIPFVALTTFLGGLIPGIAAALLAGIIADVTMIAPPGSIWPSWPDGWTAMFFYVVTISIDIALIQGMITAYQNARSNEAALKMLTQELQHRSNNLLTVVQAIAQQSLSSTGSIEEARRALLARIHALAAANKLITRGDWNGVDLADVVRTELEPYLGRFEVLGPSVLLTPQQAQNLSLAIHELATNAAKHGALSAAKGNILLQWIVTEGSVVTLRWQEQNGPIVAVPAGRGFGMTLINTIFPDAVLDFAPTGLCCVFKFSIKGGTAKAGRN